MNNIVVTDLHLVARLYRSGILKYFTNEELKFYITDFCYNHKVLAINNDKLCAKKMIEDGMLSVVTLNEHQMKKVEAVYRNYKPKFIVKTVSAIVLASDCDYKMVSEDELLMEIAWDDLKVKVHPKPWLIRVLGDEISMMGEIIDMDLVKEII